MKVKKTICYFLVIFCGLLINSQLYAQDFEGKFGLGIRAGVRSFVGDDFPVAPGVNWDVEIDTSFTAGVNATYFFSEMLSMELSADFIPDTDAYFDVMGFEFDMGELSTIPLLLTARIHIPTNTALSPYIGAGVGWYFNSFDINPTIFVPGANIDLDDSFGYHACFGIEYFFGEKKNFSLNLDGKYAWTNADITITAPGVTPFKGDIDLDGWYFAGGFKVYF